MRFDIARYAALTIALWKGKLPDSPTSLYPFDSSGRQMKGMFRLAKHSSRGL
jgi:hypothetical protein